MSAKDLLPFSATQVQDAFYTQPQFSASHSMFVYDGWTTTTNMAFRRRRLDAIGAPLNYGSTATYRLDRSAFMRGPLQLNIRRTGLTQPAGTVNNTNYRCFVDFEGFAMIHSIEVWHGQNMVQRVTGEMLYHDFIKNMDDQEQSAVAELVHGLMPLGPTTAGAVTAGARTRVDAAQEPRELFINLRKLWFTANPRKYLLCTATATEVEIRITLRNLNEITQSTDATYATGASVALAQLISFDVAVEQDEMAYLLSQTETDTGLNYKFNDVEVQLDVPLQAGQTSYIVPLTNLKGACFDLDFALRYNPRGNILSNATYRDHAPIRGKVAGGGGSTHLRNNAWFGSTDSYWNTTTGGDASFNGRDVYQVVDYHSFTTADIVVWDRCPDRYSRFYIFPTYYKGVVGNSPLYCLPLSMIPSDGTNCSGHKTISAMINPVLKLEWQAPVDYDLLLNIYSNVYSTYSSLMRNCLYDFLLTVFLLFFFPSCRQRAAPPQRVVQDFSVVEWLRTTLLHKNTNFSILLVPFIWLQSPQHGSQFSGS